MISLDYTGNKSMNFTFTVCIEAINRHTIVVVNVGYTVVTNQRVN